MRQISSQHAPSSYKRLKYTFTHLTNRTEQNPSSEADSHLASEPEGSSPCLQQPTTDPYPNPDESSPQFPTLFP
jgi:hypothetical protein